MRIGLICFILRRSMCDPEKFVNDIGESSCSCFEDINDEMTKDFYEARLEFWSKTYREQADCVLQSLNTYWVKNTESLDILVSGWRTCKFCYCDVLSIGRKRFKRIHDEWQRSGRSIHHLETAHARRLRKAPMGDFFIEYLSSIEYVTSFLFR